jgi:hypothetical protein
MGSMTCFSHSEVVEVVGAFDVFRGVPETNSCILYGSNFEVTVTVRAAAAGRSLRFD